MLLCYFVPKMILDDTDTKWLPIFQFLCDVVMQEAGFPHIRAPPSLWGGGSCPPPGVWLHAVREHIPRASAEEGEITLFIVFHHQTHPYRRGQDRNTFISRTGSDT